MIKVLGRDYHGQTQIQLAQEGICDPCLVGYLALNRWTGTGAV